MNDFPDKFSIIDFYLSLCHRENIEGVVPDNNPILLDVGKTDALEKAGQLFT